ncbi:hypothetical protein CJ030_MR4G004191 [Morella rubra]|uniref:Receptor-like serine/threonine-protein kinase n=1 Tax=Morella rubra TaxID=262757 RepID=A0A6A1VQN9_9ROSI|nr:hypothetical protein CJ030_MR4G004191 [Morella rubra]
MASQNSQPHFQDFLPVMAHKLGGDGLIGELCKGFDLLVDGDKGVITFDSLKRNSALLGLQDLGDEDLRCMIKEGDFDGDGALNQMEFCVLMFRLSPELMEESYMCLDEALQQDDFFQKLHQLLLSIFTLQLGCKELYKYKSMISLPSVFFVSNLLFFFFQVSVAIDSITKSRTLTDGRTLVSKEGTFELGFFSLGSSKNRYLGIWYENIPDRTVVWVANRRNPIIDLSGIVMINSIGNLVLLNRSKMIVWSTSSSKHTQNPVWQLLDSGNLVLRDGEEGNSESYLWQSFDYPSDTLLPGMKVGWDSKSGINRRLSSWKNADDPSPGDLAWGVELHSYPDAYMWKGSKRLYRTGHWNGLRPSGTPDLKPNPIFDFEVVNNDHGAFYVYTLKNKSVMSRLVLNQTKYSFERYTWIGPERRWNLYESVPVDHCDTYGLCGAYGNCIISESPVCQCLRGFKPKSAWVWSQGCVRNKALSCRGKAKDGFVKFVGLKLPDTTHAWLNRSMSLKECRIKCLNKCSCTAYTNPDIRGGGSGCAMWFGDLLDIRQIPESAQYLYIRMAASESEERGIVCHKNEGQDEKMELPLFDLSTITRATNKFSVDNKLGEGGFGPVYKGTLPDGQQIAVKRLSRSSTQGLIEFKNEVLLIAKLQHRNLVRLLGCCIQGGEKMLVYEYMVNKSLDFFIFDQTRRKLLDWSKRFQIIRGIARGLLYLHQDSRLRIIHRDLKASNVLLDSDMNPKISDFGMAKTFGGDQTEGNTNRVVGTYGYMAPEYAFDGLFSIKSDVFSFGILLLEIVSGKRNRGLSNRDRQNLVGDAWRLWKNNRPLEVMDTLVEDSHSFSEVLRCIHVSFLCVQQRPEDRPSMSSVVLMLGSESSLPPPKEPGFFTEEELHQSPSCSSKHGSSTTNEMSIAVVETR